MSSSRSGLSIGAMLLATQVIRSAADYGLGKRRANSQVINRRASQEQELSIRSAARRRFLGKWVYVPYRRWDSRHRVAVRGPFVAVSADDRLGRAFEHAATRNERRRVNKRSPWRAAAARLDGMDVRK